MEEKKNCIHEIKPEFMQILTMDPSFRCEKCGEYVEVIRPWRRLRMSVNIISVLALIYVAFSELQGTIKAFFLTLLLAVLIFSAFLALNYLILKKAPLESARMEVNPDRQMEIEDEESAEDEDDG